LKKLLPEDRKHIADEVFRGELGNLYARERAMVEYARKLTLTPWDVGQSDVEALRKAGLEDREVLDLVQVVGYFGYVGRLVAGLGVRLGGREGPPGQ